MESVISGCLQAMWNEGPGEPFSEHGHYINMTRASFSMVACGFYEAGGSKQVLDIPKNLTLNIPVIEGSSHVYMIDVELDVDGDPGGPITFELINHAHERTVKTAVEQEGADIREALTTEGEVDKNYNVFFGANS